MTTHEMTAAIIAAKKQHGLTWAAIANVAGLSEVFTTSACLGENSLPIAAAQNIATALELGPDIATALTEYPSKGENSPTIPKEPLQYRFQEIIYVYGSTLKALIDEKFGPGIMSAIDFTMHIDKEENPAGDRVVITMNGKFLPYKTW